MSLHPNPNFAIPEETRRVAQAAFPKGTLGLSIADAFGALYHDDQFTTLFPDRGQPTTSPARLALASVLQYVEGLSDRQAADAVLSEFRSRVVGGRLEQLLLDTLLDRCRELGLIKERGRQRTDSTHVLAAVRGLNRLERVGETLRAALNDLAVVAPDWLQSLAPSEWYQRYGRRVENYHLPKTDTARQDLARIMARDGEMLLAAIDAATDQPWLAQIPAVGTLRRVWAEQYTGDPGQLRWREVKEMPSPADLISSPYDTEARYSTKRDMNWVGYKGHLTETCEKGSQYAARAGIESTHEQAIRRCGFRSCRYIGLARTHLQHLLTATAINVIRLHDWWAGTPPAQTRCSRFAALQPAA